MAFVREVKPSPRRPWPRWRVYHETADGEVKVGTYDTQRQAEKVRDKVNRYGLDAVVGDQPPPAEDKSQISFGQYVAERWWPAWKPAHPATAVDTRYKLNKRVLPAFESIPLGDLDADMIGTWKGELVTDGLTPQSVNTYLALLSKILNAAVDSDYLERSPLRRKSGAGRVAAARNMPVDKREVWLTRTQLDALADGIDPRYRALVLMAALTGMRWGELIALRWRDPQLESRFNDGAVAGVGRLRITKAVSDPSRAGRGQEKAPKTKAGRREIALDRETVEVLRAHRKLLGGEDDELVFASPGGSRGPGGMLSSNNFNRVWKRALKEVKLDDGWPEYGGLHFHDLRHTHATWLIARHAPLIAVARRLGHASPVITTTVYAPVTELVENGSPTTGTLGIGRRHGSRARKPHRPASATTVD